MGVTAAASHTELIRKAYKAGGLYFKMNRDISPKKRKAPPEAECCGWCNNAFWNGYSDTDYEEQYNIRHGIT